MPNGMLKNSKYDKRPKSANEANLGRLFLVFLEFGLVPETFIFYHLYF